MKEDCILAGGIADGSGHHRVWSENKRRAAHRIAYCRAHNLTLSDIEGFVVMHTCDNPACVNPAHLKLGTQGMNVRDIAHLLNRSVKTVSSQKITAMRKLDVENDHALLTFCISMNLI